MLAVAAAEPHRTSGAAVSTAEPHVCAPIDANGNLASDGTKTYYWNALNQLVEVKEGTTTIATFEYDGAGRRTEKSAAGVTRNYIYDIEDIVEERITGSSSDTIRYYHGAGIDEPLARKNSSEVVSYYVADHLGSVVQETGTTGSVTLEREYDPWGVALQGGSTSGYAFTGREWDAETGVYYYRARYYDPEIGRFISSDPVGFTAGPNFYSYVGGRPSQYGDPSGTNPLVGLWEGAAIGGAIGNLPGAIIGGIVGALIGAVIAEKIIDIIGDPPYPTGPPDTTVRGDTQSRRYGPDGYPEADTDTGHHVDRFGPKHAHDWARPKDGGPPRNADRSKPRPWKPGDPAPPRSCPNQ